MDKLEIKNLHVAVEDKEIIKGLNLTIQSGEIHAIMGQNGCGKSTLCKVIMGHPKFEITKGQILFNGEEISKMETDKRARLGLFLGFQQPVEVPGVAFGNFLRQAKNASLEESKEETLSPRAFLPVIKEATANLQMDRKFMSRSLNEGFSGGEKKRAEIIQMQVLEPKIALLDEIDSGLDIDALKTVAAGINQNFQKNSPGMLLITHYPRLLNYVTPHHVHIMSDGRIIKSGDIKLAHELEEKGYNHYL